MKPSHVRQTIPNAHDQLRDQLGRMEAAVAALQDEPADLAKLIPVASELLQQLVTHTEVEDAVLGAALLDLDAWGLVRASILRAHHDDQRQQLRGLIEEYTQPRAPNELEHVTLSWIRDVRADMHHEEHDLLTFALFRDDVIAVDLQAG